MITARTGSLRVQGPFSVRVDKRYRSTLWILVFKLTNTQTNKHAVDSDRHGSRLSALGTTVRRRRTERTNKACNVLLLDLGLLQGELLLNAH
jgi:hypothetical protein